MFHESHDFTIIDVAIFQIFEPEFVFGIAHMDFLDSLAGFFQKIERLESALMNPVEIKTQRDIFRIGIVVGCAAIRGRCRQVPACGDERAARNCCALRIWPRSFKAELA